MIRPFVLLCAIVLLVLPSAAHASGGYIETALGYTCYDSSLLDGSTGARFMAGTPLTGSGWEDFLSLEIGYAVLGQTDSGNRALEYRYQVNGALAGVRYHRDLNHQLRGYARAGVFFYESSMESEWAGGWQHSQSQDPYLSIGVYSPVAEHFYMGGEIQYYRVHQLEPLSFQIVVGYQF